MLKEYNKQDNATQQIAKPNKSKKTPRLSKENRDFIKQRNEELVLLYEISRVVNSTLELNKILQFIMQMTTTIFRADAGSIMLLDKNNELHIAEAEGLPEDIIKNTNIKLGEGIAGWVAQYGEPLLLDGKVKDSRFKSLVARKEHIKSSLCVPLISKGLIIGVLMLRNPASSPCFTNEHLRFLMAIADHVAIALENARLYEAEQRKSAEISAIISSMADGLIVTTPQGEIILVNPVVENIFGINQDSVLGKHFDILFDGLHFNCHHAKVIQEMKETFTEIVLQKPSESFFRLYSTPMTGIDGTVKGVVTLLQDITELKKIGKMKSELVSLVTHELKTPLTSIQGFVEVLLVRELPRERIVNYLTIVKQETMRLVSLINNLLDLSKLEAGKLKLNKVSVDLVALIQESMCPMEQLSNDHQFIFIPSDSHKECLRSVYADRDMIAQVLNNLLSNAVKYSPLGGTVTISLICQDQYVEVSVTDEGIGIPEDKLPHLFERFYRVKTPSTKSIKGTGLGLANSKYIIEQHCGVMHVRSIEGVGSTFTFTLPIATLSHDSENEHGQDE